MLLQHWLRRGNERFAEITAELFTIGWHRGGLMFTCWINIARQGFSKSWKAGAKIVLPEAFVADLSLWLTSCRKRVETESARRFWRCCRLRMEPITKKNSLFNPFPVLQYATMHTYFACSSTSKSEFNVCRQQIHCTGISYPPCSDICDLNAATSAKCFGQREHWPDWPAFECPSLCSARTAGDGKISSQIRHLCLPDVLWETFIWVSNSCLCGG